MDLLLFVCRVPSTIARGVRVHAQRTLADLFRLNYKLPPRRYVIDNAGHLSGLKAQMASTKINNRSDVFIRMSYIIGEGFILYL